MPTATGHWRLFTSAANGVASKTQTGSVIGLFIGIILTSHVDNAFFMNWSGSQKGGGFEFHLLVVAIAVSVLITGAGRYSVDAQVAGRTGDSAPIN